MLEGAGSILGQYYESSMTFYTRTIVRKWVIIEKHGQECVDVLNF